MRDRVFESALGVWGDEAYCCGGRLVEGVRERDFAWFQTFLFGNVALGGEDEPDGLNVGREGVVGRVRDINEEVFGWGGGFAAKR